MVTREQIVEWGKRHKYRLNKSGNMWKRWKGKNYRLVLTDTTIRMETEMFFNPTKHVYKSEWLLEATGYYQHITVGANDQLIGMSSW